MKAALVTLLSSSIVAFAAPALNARQSSCPAPTDPSCKELHDRCVALPATWIQNPWSQRVCVAAATCYGVGNLLTSGACRQSISPPNPRTLPSLSNAVFANFGTCSGCAISGQNYVDFIYGTIQTHWPSSTSVVQAWWSAISSWTAFPSQNVPRSNFNDWLLYSTAPTTISNPQPTTTGTGTGTGTATTPPSTTTATSAPTSTACTSTYTVVSGDTCNGISGKTGVSVATILSLNPTVDAGCTNLQVAQVLCLAKGASTGTTTGTGTGTTAPTTTTGTSAPTSTACTTTYTVVSGDTCDGIAGKSGVSTATILSLNPTVDAGCTNLQVGQVLCLAKGASTGTTTPTGTGTTAPTGTTTGTTTPATTTTAAPTATAAIQGLVTTCKHDVAVTFDDGPDVWNGEIADQFEAVGAKTTFFINGDNYGCIYDQANVDRVRYAYEHGHEFASHTWSHPDLITLTDAQITEEVVKLEDALWKILGVKPAIIRPPFGSYNQHIVDLLNSLGYTVVTWDIDTEDGLNANVPTSVNLVQTSLTSHSMILAHEFEETTPHQLVPQLIPIIQGKGYKLTTASQCLDVPAYKAVGSYGVRDATWTC